MISSIMKSGLNLSRFGIQDFGSLHQDIKKATESVMSTTGEVSSIAFAGHLLDLIEAETEDGLDEDRPLNFFPFPFSLTRRRRETS